MMSSGRKSRGLISKLLIAVLAFLAFYLAASIFLPVFLAIALSFLLYPIVNRLENTEILGRHLPNTLSVLIAFLVFGLFLYLASLVLIVPLVNQVNTLIKAMPFLASRANESITLFLGSGAQQLPPNVRDMLQQATSTLSTNLMAVLRDMLNSTFKMAKSLVSLVLVPFLSFYFLKDWRTLKGMVVRIFSYDQQALADQVFSDIGKMLCAYVDNMFKLCFVAAGCLTVGNYILGVQYTLVLGFLAMITEMIPLVGSVVGTVSAVFIALLQNPQLALKVLILYLVYYQVDAQIIMPNMMGHSITLHPVLIILAVMVGGQLGGVAGLIFAVPVLTIIKVLYQYFWHAGEKKAGTALPSETKQG